MRAAALNVLLKMARHRLECARLAVAKAGRARDQAQAQQALLAQYADEYARRAAPTAASLRDPAIEENQRAFRLRLDDACTTQARELEGRIAALDAARTEQFNCERRLHSLQALCERRQREAHARASRLDQKLTDEIAQRADRARQVPSTHPTDPVPETPA
jgi:flagellar export protein FliJ